MEITTPDQIVTKAPTYTVEALLQKAGISSQQKIFDRIDGIVRVKGVVAKINRYPNVLYLTLTDRDFSISIKCDSKQLVIENQPIIVEGLLLLKPSNFFTGLECYIDGHIVGSWEPTNKPFNGNFQSLKKSRFVGLDDLLKDTDLTSVLLLGTEIGITDVLSQLDQNSANRIPHKIVRVGKTDSLLKDIKESISKDSEAFIIVRGGDDKTLEIWNDPEVVSFLLSFEIPFYTALGHSHVKTLTDQYADATYHTPSAFGSQLNAILVRQRKLIEITDECFRLKQENSILLSQSSSLPKELPTEKLITTKSIKFLIIYTIIMYVIIKILG